MRLTMRPIWLTLGVHSNDTRNLASSIAQNLPAPLFSVMSTRLRWVSGIRVGQVKSYSPGKHEAARMLQRSVNHRGLPCGDGLWVCMRRPELMGRVGWVYIRRRCAVGDLLSLNCGFLPRSCGCACALVNLVRSQTPASSTWGGPALQRRGPSPGGYPS